MKWERLFSLINMAGIVGGLRRFILYRRPVTVVVHVGLVSTGYLAAFLLRFDFHLPSSELQLFLVTLPLLLVVRTVVFAWFHLYQGVWRYVSMQDILAMLKAVTLSSLLFLAAVLLIFGHGFPRSIFLLDWVFCLALVGGVRLALRAVRESRQRYLQVPGRRALVVGGGDAGEMLIREVNKTLALKYDVVGFVDDDPRRQGKRIHGVEVVGTLEQLPEICRVRAIQELLIAIPSAAGEQKRRIVQRCRASGVPFRTVPALNELLQGKAKIGQLQEVRPEELLGREAVQLNLDLVRQELQGKRVMVTGAGGSIGSELCRQIAAFEPELVVLFERAESSLYFVELELKRNHPYLHVIPLVGDILDRQEVEEVIQAYAPDVLYHAAAYKHVPLMEQHPLAAMENNILGTENLALSARHIGVEKFVFISTDKAVRPVAIMGMTKRAGEGLLLSLNGGPTKFLSVRFGNVLGSDGSILPLFQWQISNGVPVTVTDADASRYFMLISEAAQLVLQAGAMGKGGETFFLNMGEPVRILDLAQNLIRLSGSEPGRDVPIEVIGLRPGERLREELVMEQEALLPTGHENVFMVQDEHFDTEGFRRDLEVLRRLVVERDREAAVKQLKVMATLY
ncbi:MAG: polysaccharide biosynthesis protein [Candidatus Binatia bacterium]